MTKQEAIKFFQQQAADEQEIIDSFEPAIYSGADAEEYIRACQRDIDACKLAIEALEEDASICAAYEASK